MSNPAPTDIAALIERLKSEAADYTAWDGNAMRNWDAWRKYIAEGGEGSWPRDNFEALLDDLAERNTEAATALAAQQAEIERLRAQIAKVTDQDYLASAIERIGMVDAEWQRRAETAESTLAARDETIREVQAELALWRSGTAAVMADGSVRNIYDVIGRPDQRVELPARATLKSTEPKDGE